MRNLLLALLMMIALLTGCGYVKGYDKPHLEISANMPYVLRISDFDWGYGRIEINKFSGDFEKLDKKVFDLLKGKQGICSIYLELKDNDKYGATNSSFKYIGVVELKELNKFQDWEYWHKDGGIRHLIYSHIVSPPNNADSAKMDTTVMQPVKMDTATKMPVVQQTQNQQPSPINSVDSYTFGLDDLYPTQEKPSTLTQNRFIINGTVGNSNMSSGLFQITTTDDDLITMQFYPDNMSQSVIGRLLQALKNGYTIRCVGVKTDTTTYDLLAAKITVSQ